MKKAKKSKNKAINGSSFLSQKKPDDDGNQHFSWDISNISFNFPADVEPPQPCLLTQKIIPALQKCQHAKWQKIENNPKHRYVDMTSLPNPAPLKWLQKADTIKILEFYGGDEETVQKIFCFHIGDDKYLFGIRDRAIFRILWYDENASAYSLNSISESVRDKFGDKYFEWDISRLDHEFPYGVQEHLTTEHLNKNILPTLQQHEDKKWSSLHGDKHHFLHIANSSNPAPLKQLETENLENIAKDFFSFRLTNKIRLYGYVENAVFKILWYDHHHIIYPSPKKNT